MANIWKLWAIFTCVKIKHLHLCNHELSKAKTIVFTLNLLLINKNSSLFENVNDFYKIFHKAIWRFDLFQCQFQSCSIKHKSSIMTEVPSDADDCGNNDNNRLIFGITKRAKK